MNRAEAPQFHVVSPSQKYMDYPRSRDYRPWRVEDVNNLPKPSLAAEVDKINAARDHELYFLKNAGFQTKAQVDLLMQNIKDGVPLEKSFQQIEQDIHAFKTEYLVEGPLFPIVLNKVQKEGKTRIAGKLYADKLWVDAIDEKERDGAVKQSVLEMEQFLIDARPGSLVMMTSPSGWSGYDGITYPDTQTYAVEVQRDGSLRGFTLKTDMSLTQNKELLGRYRGLDHESLSNLNDKTAIKQLVSTVIKFYPEDKKKIEGIIQDIKHIKDNEVAYVDSIGRSRYFLEMMEHLANPESLWTLDETTQELADKLKEYISYRIQQPDPTMAQDIRVALGYTILQLMYKVRPPIRGAEMRSGAVYHPSEEQTILPFDPRREAEEMSKIPGCAGGGNNGKNGTVDSVTTRRAILNGEASLGDKCSCGANLDNHYHCPGCNKKYADETHVAEGARTKTCENKQCGFKFGC